MKIETTSPEQAHRLRSGAVGPVDARELRLTGPLRHVAALDGDGSLLARCSIWLGRDGFGNRTADGLIGHFRAGDDESARAVLERACQELSREGCARAVGPIDGSIWQPYGLIIEGGDHPPFFGEPRHSPEALQAFTSLDFAPAATFFSGMNRALEVRDPRTPERLQSLRAFGMTFRGLDLQRIEEEIEQLYEVSIVAFTGNVLYSPIDLPTFREIHAPVVPYLVSGLVQVAEMNGRMVGYAFGLPNVPASEEMVLTAIATLPSYSGGGLAAVLGDLCHEAGHKLGYRRAIHSFMFETERSRALSARFGGDPIRRYAVFARDLEP